MEINSKGVKTNQEMKGIGTQSDISQSVSIRQQFKDQSKQFNGIGESIFETEEDTERESQYSEHYSSSKKSDTDFLQYDGSNSMEGKEQNEMNSSAKTIFCSSGYKDICRSQSLVNQQSYENIKFSVAVLLSANTYLRMARTIHLTRGQWLGKTQYCTFQKKYLAGVVNEAYNKLTNALTDFLRVRNYCYFSGDGRCGSPGHSPKYLTYSMLDQARNTIVSMSVTQATKAGNSNNMEKLGFIKTLNSLKKKNRPNKANHYRSVQANSEIYPLKTRRCYATT